MSCIVEKGPESNDLKTYMENSYLHLKKLRSKEATLDSWMKICWVWRYINLLESRGALKIYYLPLPLVLYLNYWVILWGSGASWKWTYELQSIHPWGSEIDEHLWGLWKWRKDYINTVVSEKDSSNLTKKDIDHTLHTRALRVIRKSDSKYKCIIFVPEMSQDQPSE